MPTTNARAQNLRKTSNSPLQIFFRSWWCHQQTM